MKLKLYSHMNDAHPGMEITRQQLEKIVKSGLINVAEIHFFTNFNPLNYQWMKEKLKDYPNVFFRYVDADPREWEISTLATLKDDCDNLQEECYIGYIHHKGITHYGRPSEPFTIEWRQMLEYFIIEKWKYATDLLDTYEIAGVNWTEFPWPHFSGNFWWARSSYIKKLPKLRRPREIGYDKSQFGDYTQNWPYQYDAEVWSAMSSPNFFNLHTSIKNHYIQGYPESLYRRDLKEIYEQGRSKYGESPELFTDKGSWHSYVDFYSDNFNPHNSVKLLEVGVRAGGSIWLWKHYFLKYEIWGVDILPGFYGDHSFTSVIKEDQNIHLHWNTNSRLKETYENFPKDFDIIIDDGDHSPSAQFDTLYATWNLLKPGGMYIIEDIQNLSLVETFVNEIKKFSPNSKVTSHVFEKRVDDIILKILK